MKVRLPKEYTSGGAKGNMMTQFQQIQDAMAAKQEELNQTDFAATAGGGAVSAVVTGAKTLKSIKIDPDAVDTDDMEMLEDLICAAVNEALEKAESTSNEEIGKITGGLNLPGM